jgi:mannose-6-phosphate isomerase-like protein (cupin superfamily)
VVEDPVRRQRYSFTPLEDGGLELAVEVDPGGDVPPHLHPRQTERFEVLSGEIAFTRGRERVSAGPGDVVEVPPGTRHAFRNRTSAKATMRVQVRPAYDLREFLEEMAALGRAGAYTRLGLPRSLSGLLGVSRTVMRHRRDTVVLFPPPRLQPLLLGPFARLAESRERG